MFIATEKPLLQKILSKTESEFISKALKWFITILPGSGRLRAVCGKLLPYVRFVQQATHLGPFLMAFTQISASLVPFRVSASTSSDVTFFIHDELNYAGTGFTSFLELINIPVDFS